MGNQPMSPGPALPATAADRMLAEIYQVVVGNKPRRDFNAQQVTLSQTAPNNVYKFSAEVIPRYFVIIMDKSSVAGANLEVHDGEFAASPWITLSPGNYLKFPAKVAQLVVRNTGTQPVKFMIAALGDDDFVYMD